MYNYILPPKLLGIIVAIPDGEGNQNIDDLDLFCGDDVVFDMIFDDDTD